MRPGTARGHKPEGQRRRERRGGTGELLRDRSWLEVAGNEVVRTPVPASIHFDGYFLNAFAVCVERVQKISFVRLDARLQPHKRIRANEKACFHSTLVPPKTNGMTRRVVGTATIGELEHKAASEVRVQIRLKCDAVAVFATPIAAAERACKHFARNGDPYMGIGS
jgi:hypothetical protein